MTDATPSTSSPLVGASALVAGATGGLGSAIADALMESGDAFELAQMFVSRIPKSARTPDEMLEMCGLTAQDIVNRVMELLGVPA